MPTQLHASQTIVSRPAASLPSMAGLFRRLVREPMPAMLDSAGGPPGLSRLAVLAFDPFRVLTHADGRSTLTRSDGSTGADVAENPFAALRRELARFAAPAAADSSVASGAPSAAAGSPPLACGAAIGYLGYELGRYVERLPAAARRDIALPDMHWAFYDSLLVVDLESGRAAIHATDLGGRDPQRLVERWQRLIDEAAREPAGSEPPPARPGAAVARAPGGTGPTFGELECSFTREAYLAAVARTIEYIAAGDIFQANLSQRFTAPLACSPAELYLRLRQANPAPFAAYLAGGDWAVLSSSPERFLRVIDRHVATRPIKGTRPRRPGDEAFNARSRAELLASEKDAAELAMIIDLERNDLGRVCSFGTVRVTEPRTLEAYASVWHSVAQVEGRLHDGLDLVDLLKATFPGGSITGAPKVRAMEIIDELEPTCRSVYTGAIGYVGFDGRTDLNIAIRTLIVDRGRVHLQVGGGIVADSTPEAEYDETLAKARSMLEALGITI